MRNARDGRNGVLRGTPSTVATVATVAEEKMALKERGGSIIQSFENWLSRLSHRTHSHRTKFCVQKGLGCCPQ